MGSNIKNYRFKKPQKDIFCYRQIILEQDQCQQQYQLHKENQFLFAFFFPKF
jgi:hypothetical protein